MNTFGNETYYEILKIPPEADASVIESAYREALETYGENSLVTYELFSDEQRADLLQTIDQAFHTLMDAGKRQAYDQVLIAAGRLPARPAAPAGLPVPPAANRPAAASHRDLPAWVKQKAQEPAVKPLIEEILAKDLISGSDLKRLREACEVELSEIYAKSKISAGMLRLIEDDQFEKLPADVYLRSFIRSYAEIMQVDARRLVEGYFKNKASGARPRR